MCCFSRKVESVSATKIFARADEGGRQFLAYSMSFHATEELAMVLPLPVKAGAGEAAVRFIDLHEYGDFFEDLQKGFPVPVTRSAPPTKGIRAAAEAPKLAVVSVGSFEASFVPTLADFSRLDARFQLPAGTWDKLPAYKSYGFAVFKLKPEVTKVHPMAFSFPRASPGTLFFPTVHIHDGTVHPEAYFDHALFHQVAASAAAKDWDESPDLASRFMDVKKAKGLVLGEQHVYRRVLRGNHPNQDTTVG